MAEEHWLEGSKIEEIIGIDLNECRGRCVLNKQCKSINFRNDDPRLCQLNSKSSHDNSDRVRLTKNDEWDFYTTNYSVRAVSTIICNNLKT